MKNAQLCKSSLCALAYDAMTKLHLYNQLRPKSADIEEKNQQCTPAYDYYNKLKNHM